MIASLANSLIVGSVFTVFTFQGLANMIEHSKRIEAEEKHFQKELYCAAKNIYFEANNQNKIEKKAIMEVVLNRVDSKLFPNSICEVVYQAILDSQGNPIRNKCQFSWYCDGKKEIIEDNDGFEEAYSIAYETILMWKNHTLNLTNDSLWYHADYVRPYWSRVYQKQVQIGKHIFYSKN